jgi:heme-degrading monooxygenase HmoA
MLVKWIRCAVSESDRDAFSAAQSRWSAIAEAPRLVAQLGGWDEKSTPRDACILSAWQDRTAYDHFMASIHDRVTDANAQAGLYSSIRVDLMELAFPMPGTEPGLVEAVDAAAGYLRVAECTVQPPRVDHFVGAQRDVWLPAMSAAPGMRGGWFLRGSADPAVFTVVTAWASVEQHDAYARHRVPELRAQADVSADLVQMTGRFVRLEPAWQVVPA